MSRIIKLWLLLFFFVPAAALSYEFPPERSNSDAETEFGWMVLPLPIVVEGIGSGVPIAAAISNVYKSADLLMAKTFFEGDFEINLF